MGGSILHAPLFHQNDGFYIGSLNYFSGEAENFQVEAFKQFFYRNQKSNRSKSNTADYSSELGIMDFILDQRFGFL